MRKIFALLLAMTLLLTVLPAFAETAPDTATIDENGFRILQFGEKIDMDFANLTITNADVNRLIGRSSRWRAARDNQRFFCLEGTIENTCGFDLQSTNLVGEIVFNDTYHFETFFYFVIDEAMRNELLPLNSAECCLFVEIPESFISQITTCEVTFGLNDVFSAASIIEDCQYRFKLTLDDAAIAYAKEGPHRTMQYYYECPIWPAPQSYLDVTNSGRSGYFDDQERYTFGKFFQDEDISTYFEAYIDCLSKDGFKLISYKENLYVVYDGSTMLGSMKLDDKNYFSVYVLPGNENLFERADSSPADTSSSIDMLTEYTDKDTIKAAQAALNAAGYDCGTSDGIAGKGTAAAVTQYQTDNGLTVTGTITHELLIALGLQS